MNKKWFQLLYFLPLLVILAAVNIIVDPASIFSSKEELWADSILTNKITYLDSENFNERKTKKFLIEKMPKKVDCIVVGPSLIMGIRKKHAGTDSFYNLGVSGGDIYDDLAQFAFLEINGVKFDRVIISVDSYLFNKKLHKKNVRNRYYKSYSNYMKNIINNKPAKIYDIGFSNFYDAIGNVFSLSYFQTSLKYVIKKDSQDNKQKSQEYSYDDILNIDGPAYLDDASYVYPIKFQRKNKADFIESIKLYNDIRKNGDFGSGTHIDEDCQKTFEKLINYFIQKGVKVELVLSPLPPTYWEILQKGDYPIIKEIDEYTKYLQNKYPIKVTGASNPYEIGIKDEDFYDARHVRHELLEKYFDFKE